MNFGQKRLTVTKEKKLEKIHYRIFIGLMIFGILYYLFLEPTKIGHDNRYDVYIFWLPTISGLFIFAIYRRRFLIYKYSTNKGFILWTFMTVFYLFQGILFSYLSFGNAAKISWNILNNRTAKQNIEEVFQCQVTMFRTGRSSNKIYFLFNNRNNKIDVQYKTIKNCLDKNPDDYYLKITARKGLWDYYLVESWTLETNK